MANNTPIEAEIRRLLKLNEQELEEALVAAVSQEDDLLREMQLPATEPPQSLQQVFASFNPKEQFRRVKEMLENASEKSKDALYEIICVKLNYCRQRDIDEVGTLATISMGLMGQFGVLLVHPALWVLPVVVVYLHRNRFFDKLCKCPAKK